MARFEELQSQDYQKRNETNELFIPPGPRLGDKVLEVTHLRKSYGDRVLIDDLSFAIPKGAKNKDTAMKFLAEISKAELQANLPLHITYGPTNKAAYDLGVIDDALARRMPSHPDNAKLQLCVRGEPVRFAQVITHLRTQSM